MSLINPEGGAAFERVPQPLSAIRHLRAEQGGREGGLPWALYPLSPGDWDLGINRWASMAACTTPPVPAGGSKETIRWVVFPSNVRRRSSIQLVFMKE